MQKPGRATIDTLLRRTHGSVNAGQAAFPSLDPKTLTLVLLMLCGDVELNPGPEAIRCVCSSEEEEGLNA